VQEAFKRTHWEKNLTALRDAHRIRSIVFHPNGSISVVSCRSRNRNAYHLAALLAHYLLPATQKYSSLRPIRSIQRFVDWKAILVATAVGVLAMGTLLFAFQGQQAAVTTPAEAVAQGLEQIRRADPSFEPAHFLEGARTAFEMIVTGFAHGDKEALRPLLSDEVFQQFVAAIDERAAAKETLETRIVRLDNSEIVEAELLGRNAQVTVRLTSQQINVTRAMDGSIVDGDPEHPAEKTDYWTFARDTRSADPNWVLVATSSG
jgi:hypothetical protein